MSKNLAVFFQNSAKHFLNIIYMLLSPYRRVRRRLRAIKRKKLHRMRRKNNENYHSRIFLMNYFYRKKFNLP